MSCLVRHGFTHFVRNDKGDGIGMTGGEGVVMTRGLVHGSFIIGEFMYIPSATHVYTFDASRIYVQPLTYIRFATCVCMLLVAASTVAADVAQAVQVVTLPWSWKAMEHYSVFLCPAFRRQSYNLHRLTLSLFVTICYFSSRFGL